MNLFDLYAKITLDKSGYDEGIDDASEKASSFSNKLKSGLANAGKAAAIGIGAVTTATTALYAGVTAAAGQVAAYGDNIDKMSQKMGMSAEAYQEWDAVMQHSGTSIESLQSGMKTLANAVESGNDAFERLGISQEEIAKMSNEELFSATITALQNVDNETERTYLAGQLLGRGATELGALLNTSAEDTQAMKDRVHELGGVMSDEAVKASARYQDSLQDMQTSFSGLKNNLIADFLPGMATIMDGVGSMMAGEDGAQSLLTDGISQMIETMNGAIPNFFSAAEQIIGAISEAVTENLPSMIEGGLDLLLNLADGFADNIDKIVPTVVDTVLTIVDTLTNPDSISKLIGAAVKIIGAVAIGLIEAIPDLVIKIPEIVSSIVQGFMDALPDIIDVGKQIIEGLWEGIKSMASWIGDKVSGFVGGLVDDVKGVLGIHSPSRVFAGIGENMALGLGEGWDDEYGRISQNIKSGLDFGTASVDFASSGLGISSAGIINSMGYGKSGGMSVPGSIELKLTSEDGQIFGRWMVPFIRSEDKSNPEVVSDAV